MNSKLSNFVGDYIHISNSWEIPMRAHEDPKKRTGPSHLHLNELNNLFVDLESVQRSMVRHYDITTTGA